MRTQGPLLAYLFWKWRKLEIYNNTIISVTPAGCGIFEHVRDQTKSISRAEHNKYRSCRACRRSFDCLARTCVQHVLLTPTYLCCSLRRPCVLWDVCFFHKRPCRSCLQFIFFQQRKSNIEICKFMIVSGDNFPVLEFLHDILVECISLFWTPNIRSTLHLALLNSLNSSSEKSRFSNLRPYGNWRCHREPSPRQPVCNGQDYGVSDSV